MARIIIRLLESTKDCICMELVEDMPAIRGFLGKTPFVYYPEDRKSFRAFFCR